MLKRRIDLAMPRRQYLDQYRGEEDEELDQSACSKTGGDVIKVLRDQQEIFVRRKLECLEFSAKCFGTAIKLVCDVIFTIK